MKKVVIFIFRRDLRWNDNVGLTKAYEYALSNQLTLVPVFIFNQKQINPAKNHFYSENSFRFLLECLNDLHGKLRYLHVRESDIEALEALNKSYQVKAIFFNRDFTPFARNRDDMILEWGSQNGVHVHGDWLEYSLINIPAMAKPYQIYGAFLQRYQKEDVPKPTNNEHVIVSYIKRPKNPGNIPKVKNNDKAAVRGGRVEATKKLHLIHTGKLDDYERTRDFPSVQNGTTMMSAYLKYGCLSIRELYWALKNRKAAGEKVIRELFWRAYYEQIAYHFPHVLSGQLRKDNYNLPLNIKNNKQSWVQSTDTANAIMTGKTGLPLVDAAVRQLITTGFMHNRLRMVVCMLACRHLRMDWRLFERWFATHLIDYYPVVNRMSWEWSVTYRFTLNPWVQQQKFDKDCNFIKQWIPELSNVPNKDIHKWYQAHLLYPDVAYSRPPILLR